MVEVERPGETLATHDAAANGGVVVHRNDQFVAESLVISFGVIMCRESETS
jgi:hypothetical protein